jgi:hypothetical protein
MLNLPVFEVILNQPCIRALVVEGEAAGVAQHVRMGSKGQGRCGAAVRFEEGIFLDGSTSRVISGRDISSIEFGTDI